MPKLSKSLNATTRPGEMQQTQLPSSTDEEPLVPSTVKLRDTTPTKHESKLGSHIKLHPPLQTY